MISITRSIDCGNSPKNKRIEEMTLTLLTKKYKGVEELRDGGTEFRVQFENRLHKFNSLDEFKEIIPDSIGEIVFKHSITHGKAGSSWGSLKTDEHSHIFITSFEFNNVKLARPLVIQIFISAPDDIYTDRQIRKK